MLFKGNKKRPFMKIILYVMVIVLALFHQDFWNFDNNTLVFGFLPTGLAYHAAYTIFAVILWLLFIKFAWPNDNEDVIESAVGDA